MEYVEMRALRKVPYRLRFWNALCKDEDLSFPNQALRKVPYRLRFWNSRLQEDVLQ